MGSEGHPENEATPGKRRYAGTRRAAATAERRDAIVATAVVMLRDGGAAKLSLERVARAAGVTRLTVYNQFGSRQGLLAAVAEVLAQAGGMARLADAAREPDAEVGLAMTVERFCRFWAGDAAVGNIRAAIGADPEVAAALASRLALRRDLITGLVARIRPEWDDARRTDAVDLVRVLIDHPSVTALSCDRSPDLVAKLILDACRAVLRLPIHP